MAKKTEQKTEWVLTEEEIKLFNLLKAKRRSLAELQKSLEPLAEEIASNERDFWHKVFERLGLAEFVDKIKVDTITYGIKKDE